MARPDVSNERKNQILDTAALVFARRGFHQARIDDIVEDSGLSKGAIYWYFKSKSDIMLALVLRFFDSEMLDMQSLLEQDSPVQERLSIITKRIASDIAHITEVGLLPLFYEFYAQSAHEPDIRVVLQDYSQKSRSIFASLLQQGIDRGEFRPIDTKATALTIVALYEGLILFWVIDAENMGDIGQRMLDSLQMVLGGITQS